jgi:hypothetical protein
MVWLIRRSAFLSLEQALRLNSEREGTGVPSRNNQHRQLAYGRFAAKLFAFSQEPGRTYQTKSLAAMPSNASSDPR